MSNFRGLQHPTSGSLYAHQVLFTHWQGSFAMPSAAALWNFTTSSDGWTPQYYPGLVKANLSLGFPLGSLAIAGVPAQARAMLCVAAARNSSYRFGYGCISHFSRSAVWTEFAPLVRSWVSCRARWRCGNCRQEMTSGSLSVASFCMVYIGRQSAWVTPSGLLCASERTGYGWCTGPRALVRFSLARRLAANRANCSGGSRSGATFAVGAIRGCWPSRCPPNPRSWVLQTWSAHHL